MTAPVPPADATQALPPDLQGMPPEEQAGYAALPEKMKGQLLKEIDRQIFLMQLNEATINPVAELRPKLRRALLLNQPLRVKLGIDPSRPDLHLGHTVVLNKLRDLQELGHQAVLIIGDFTASIGDPSGRSAERPALDLAETKAHAQTYFEQAGLVIDMQRAEVRYNSEWLEHLDLTRVLQLARVTTVARMLERDDFSKRFSGEKPISIAEFLYPLAQGYDSVMVEADIELGGTDQTFNLLLGREVQRAWGQEPQITITSPLLPGLDGSEKMSKSNDNYVALLDSPFEKFSKVMSIPDSAMLTWYRLLTKLLPEQFEELVEDLASGAKHPKEAKQDIARMVVTRYHSLGTAADMQDRWEAQFSRKEIPTDVPLFNPPADIMKDAAHAKLVDLLEAAGLTPSKSEGRRLIKQKGVKVDGIAIENTEEVLVLDRERLLQIGSRKFLRVQATVKEGEGGGDATPLF
ncbi:MAG: Tyrosine--tRNA ligase [bacterium]|nr:Tyrosine--tRNA ligase [bacterium]